MRDPSQRCQCYEVFGLDGRKVRALSVHALVCAWLFLHCARNACACSAMQASQDMTSSSLDSVHTLPFATCAAAPVLCQCLVNPFAPMQA